MPCYRNCLIRKLELGIISAEVLLFFVVAKYFLIFEHRQEAVPEYSTAVEYCEGCERGIQAETGTFCPSLPY